MVSPDALTSYERSGKTAKSRMTVLPGACRRGRVPQPQGSKDLPSQKCIQGCVLHLLCSQVAGFPVGHRHLDHQTRSPEHKSLPGAREQGGWGGGLRGKESQHDLAILHVTGCRADSTILTRLASGWGDISRWVWHVSACRSYSRAE